jgi:hypothetical protein
LQDVRKTLIKRGRNQEYTMVHVKNYAATRVFYSFASAIVEVVIFFLLKLTVAKKWYEKPLKNSMIWVKKNKKRISRKGISFFVIASLPVIIFMPDRCFQSFKR